MVHPAVNGFRDGHGRLEYLGHPTSFGPRSDLRQKITLEGRKHDRTEVRKRMNLSAVADTSFELFPPATMSADTRQDQRQWEVGLIMKNNRTGHMDVVQLRRQSEAPEWSVPGSWRTHLGSPSPG